MAHCYTDNSGLGDYADVKLCVWWEGYRLTITVAVSKAARDLRVRVRVDLAVCLVVPM